MVSALMANDDDDDDDGDGDDAELRTSTSTGDDDDDTGNDRPNDALCCDRCDSARVSNC
jgi:hypothetical protein